MELDMQNFSNAGFDVFSMFSQRWALVTAGTTDNFNCMTIGWGALGSIWGAPGDCRQIVEVFVRDNRRTFDFMQENEYFTVSFFPPEYKKDLGILGSVSGHRDPEKLRRTSLTPKAMGLSVGFEEAELSFVCRKIYCQPLHRELIPRDIIDRMYTQDEHMHYMFFGEICGIEGKSNNGIVSTR